MTVRNLARVSNAFEPSDQSLALADLLSLREIAALLSVRVHVVRDRIRRSGIEAAWNRGGTHRYWSRRQIEHLRRAP